MREKGEEIFHAQCFSDEYMLGNEERISSGGRNTKNGVLKKRQKHDGRFVV